MTTKTLTGVYDAAYVLASPVTTLSIATSGYLLAGLRGGAGSYKVVNFGGVYGVALSDDSSVASYGTIQSTLRSGVGVYLKGGGAVTNGNSTHVSALIEGGSALTNPYTNVPALDGGVLIAGGAGSVINYGTIRDRTIGDGVLIESAAVVTNGANTDTKALIQGLGGVVVQAAGTVTNFGSIEAVPNDGKTGAGVYILKTGSVINGSNADTGALITGFDGLYVGAAAAVSNLGTIEGATSLSQGAATPVGVILHQGGVATNGSSADKVALIKGADGLVSAPGFTATLNNFGSILGGTAASYVGVQLAAGSLTNGSTADITATIEGAVGVTQGETYTAAVTVTNFGTILGNGIGAGSKAVSLGGTDNHVTNGSATDTTALIEGADAVVAGVGATVINFGTLSGGLSVYMDGSTSRLFLEAGSVMIGYAYVQNTLIDVVGGVASIEGGLSTSGKIEGSGTLDLSGSYIHLDSGAALVVTEIEETGAASIVNVNCVLADAETFVETAGTFKVATGERMAFSGVGDSFAGTLSGTGEVEFDGGTDLLTGVVLSATTVVVSNATVSLSGDIDLESNVVVTTPDLVIATGGATLSDSGDIDLTTTATNEISGGALTNQSTIMGAGAISVTSLVNSGVIDADSADAMTIATGTATLVNSGLIENTSTGGLTIESAISNGGTLESTRGTLTLEGSITGSGTVEVAGGTVDLAGAFTGAVSYTSTGGVLVVAYSRTDKVTVTGFPKTNIGSIDLQDIKFSGATETFSGTTTSGTLTIKNGANVATITLEGNYTTSTFTMSADASGGTLVVDPVGSAKSGRTSLPLVSAAAAFGAFRAGGSVMRAFAIHSPASMTLVHPD